jgi:type I restriction enzyme S subunit
MVLAAENQEVNRPLPPGWRWVRLGKVCTVHPGQHILESDYNRESRGIGYLTGPADFGRLSACVTKWTEKPKAWSEPGDVLVTVKGAGVGKINLAPTERVAIGRQLMAVRPTPGGPSQQFLYWILTTRFFDLQTAALGSTVPGLGLENIESLNIPLPPATEQKRIATILNDQLAAVERARAAAEAQLEAAKAFPAAYLRAIFSSQEAQKWPTVSLSGLLLRTRNGLYKPEEFYGRGTRILKMFNIGRLDGTWDLSRVDLIDLTETERQTYGLAVGDILLNRVNSRELVGKCALVDENVAGAVYESKNMRVRVDPAKTHPRYLAICLNSILGRRQIQDRLKQIVGQATINRSDLNSLRFPVPPIEFQVRLSAMLDEQMSSTARTIKAIEEELDVINKLPAALLRRAFSGEL